MTNWTLALPQRNLGLFCGLNFYLMYRTLLVGPLTICYLRCLTAHGAAFV
jgi:hypothetical protein